jgi:hypothetical protein
MASTCLKCGLPLSAEDEFCGNCGQQTGLSNSLAARQLGPIGAPPEPGRPAGDPITRPVWPATEPGRSARTPPPPLHPRQSAFADGDAQVRIAVRAAESVQENAAADAAPGAERARDAALADRRLSYTAVSGEPSFDPLRNTRFGWQLLRRAGLFWLFGAGVEAVIFIFLLLVATVSRSVGALAALPVVGTLLAIGLVVAYLFLPVPALLAQWSRLLGFRAAAAEIAYEHITAALESHATPRDSLQRRTLVPPGEGVRHYLELRRGVFAGYISCFEHGQDLYVGWTFWIYMSPLRLVLMKFGRQFQDWTGRGNDMYQTLRYESTRATIAALHACTQEGIGAAVRTVSPDADIPDDEADIPIS